MSTDRSGSFYIGALSMALTEQNVIFLHEQLQKKYYVKSNQKLYLPHGRFDFKMMFIQPRIL